MNDLVARGGGAENANFQDELLTADDVARMIRVSRARAYELMRRQILPTVRLGRQVRVSSLALRIFIQRGGVPLHD